MIATILNCRAVQPFVVSQYLTVSKVSVNIPRLAYHDTFTIASDTPVTSVTLSHAPIHIGQLSIFIDGFRVINSSLDFGHSWTQYDVSGQIVTFNTPVSGKIDVWFDNPWIYELPDAHYLSVANVQGAKAAGITYGALFAGLFCEPLILSMPTNGFVRLTDDHLKLVYVPNQNFAGSDAFSYTVLTDRGQIAEPKCVYVTVKP